MKCAIFLAEGFEEIEAISIMDVIRRGGYDLDVISIIEEVKVTGAHDIPVVADKVFSEADFDQYELLILPGGMPGTLNLGNHIGLGKELLKAKDQGKYIAAICAAPSVLGQLGMLEGVKATCYPGVEPKLTGAIVTDEDIVVDGKIYTGRGAGVAMAFGFELLMIENEPDEVKKLEKSMIFKR